MKESLKEQAKSYFANYPNIEIFFVTEDGNFFTKKHDAAAHAKAGEVITDISRADLEEKALPELPEELKVPTDKSTKAEIVAYLESIGVKEIDPNLTKAELLALIQED